MSGYDPLMNGNHPMKTTAIAKVDPKRVEALGKSPEIAGFLALCEKVNDGSATPEERAEFDARTKRARELDPNVLVD